MTGLKELAEQAGMHYRQFEDEFCKAGTDGVPMEMLEAFAKLVAAKEREKFLRLSTKAKDVDENCNIVLAADIRGNKA